MGKFVIINPRSAKGKTERAWPAIKEELDRRVGDYRFALTGGVGHATELARKALIEGAEQLIAVGGDGTLSEVVDGFFDKGGPVNPDAALSYIISGTGGDFRRTLMMSENLAECVAGVAEGDVRKVDCGRLTYVSHDGSQNTRHFINIASFGMGGEMDMRVNRSKFFGKMGAKPAFLSAAFITLLSYRNKKVLVRTPEFEEKMIVRACLVCNGRFGGGGMMWAPDADISDGLFDVVVLGDIGRFKSMINMGKIYKGEHIGLDGVKSFRASWLEASSDDEVLLDVDGEAPGRLPARFEILPEAINLKCL